MNSKHCQILLFLSYTLFSSGFIISGLRILGVPISPAQYAAIMTGWVLYCVGIGPFASSHYLFRHSKVRKPVLAEEKLITSLFSEVQSRSKFRKVIRMGIIEDSGLAAFATGTRTIAISKDMLKILGAEELKGIMAHELGHLESWDCILGAALITASSIPIKIHRLFSRIANMLFKGCLLVLLAIGMIVILFLAYAYLLYSHGHPSHPISIFFIFMIVFPIFQRLTIFCWHLISRFREYRQDAFAHSLGYGEALLE
ncbi:MAG TPA: M48 family metalloprotease, partial [Puia sp.]|nr:M48 family metalloprotease [Puia sp.]